MDNALLIIFVKNPVLGKVKTRLAISLGDEKALKVYKILLKKTQQVTSQLPMHQTVYYAEKMDKYDLWSNEHYEKRLQSGHDLGTRMYRAFKQGFEQKHAPVAIIGSDCYEITPEIILDGFHLLNENDVVIGPAKDGGYYFIGMRKFYPTLFNNKSWSTSKLLTETKTDLKGLSLKYALLQELADVDEEKDLGPIKDLL